ncbi:hypothetical protein [Acinetobacter sp. CAAS 2-6]|uniref:hypothetical protein n=1 Tax=Acinetobacter sp. CAAS 2-6 TaxID=3016358 RepID=UPI002DD63B39|nr:hypothetical protein [Acinetobacter sp. CAAS 2-6]
MSEANQSKDQQHILLNMLIIALETVFSFVLKYDRVVRLQTKKWVEQKVSVKINSYIPYFDFYVQFTPKGILFDLTPPEKIDLEVNTTLLDLIRIFVFANRRSVKHMRIQGDSTLKDEFYDLVLHFSLPKLLSDWREWLKQPADEQNIVASKKRILPLLEKIDQQRSQINSLQVEVKQYKNRLRRMQQKQRWINLIFASITLLLLAILLYTWLAN